MGGLPFQHIQPLGDGKVVVHERELHVLARTVARRREHDGEVLLHQLAQAAEQLVGIARHVHALDGQLVVDGAAHAHERQVGRPLASAEVHPGWFGEQPLQGDVGSPGRFGMLVGSMHGVVEQRARLDEHAQHVRCGIVAQSDRRIVQVRQQRVGALEMQAALELLEQLAQRGIRARRPFQLVSRTRRHLFRARELAYGVDVNGIQGRDRLASRRHDATDLVQLVAEEVQPHGKLRVAGEHVDNAALDGEGARSLQLARVLVAALLERTQEVVELRKIRLFGAGHVHELTTCHERQRHMNARIGGRQHAQQGTRARHDDAVASLRQHVRRFQPARHRTWVARLGVEGHVSALAETEHALVAQVCRNVARKRNGRVLAGHDDERRLGLVRIPRRHHERPRGRRHAERRVLARIQLSPERVQRARLLDRICQRFDKHEGHCSRLNQTERRGEGVST